MPRIPKHQFHFHRLAERIGPRHAVASTFRPRRKPLDPDGLVADESLRVSEGVIWYGAAALYGVTGLIGLFGAAVPDFFGMHVPYELRDPLQVTTSVVALVLAGVWVWFGWQNMPTIHWLHPMIGLSVLLLALATLEDMQYATEMMGFFIMPAIAAAFYLPLRQAIPHLIAIAAVLVYIGVYNAGQEYAGSEVGFMLIFLFSASMIMALARDRIQRGIELNVEIAGRDPLTGVANLRELRERLKTEVRRSQRRDAPLTVVMVDFDDFKLVNEQHSHTLGDAVLVACARAMQRVVRKGEMLARRGGDEFAVIAVGETSEELNGLIERLRGAVRRERERLCPGVTPEISVGFATWREGESGEALIRRADSSLHIARSLGENL